MRFVSFRVDPELHDRLAAICRTRDRSVSAELRRLVRRHVKEAEYQAEYQHEDAAA